MPKDLAIIPMSEVEVKEGGRSGTRTDLAELVFFGNAKK